ncbi:MAG: hypothetical protein GX254_03280 [Clostridiales bacterium]|jgi:hypothetical protein|nr:hypothetical protein [Clostridiales bacterium]
MDNKPDAPDKYKVKLDYEIPKLKPKIIGGKMLLPEKEERNENHVTENEGQYSYCIF